MLVNRAHASPVCLVMRWASSLALARNRLVLAACLWGVASCSGSPHLIIPDAHTVDRTSLAALLAAHPLPSGENLTAVALGRTDAFSYHLVQIRDRERPHVHATHDLAVTLLRGTGQVVIAGHTHAMRAGDVAVIAHGTPHYFINLDSTPAVTFVTFAPPYDGKDQVPVE